MILYAINISSGGGKVLLDEVISNSPLGKPTVLFLDERYIFPAESKESDFTVVRIKPKLLHRWKAELLLKKAAQKNPEQQTFCFGNLPPFFRLKTKTIVYLQNAFLLPTVGIPKDNLKTFLRSFYERCWFNLFLKNSDEVWVQTQWMKKSLNEKFKLPVIIRPIVPKMPNLPMATKSIDFISITGIYKHKNLISLLTAIKNTQNTDLKFVIVSDATTPAVEELLNEIKALNINLNFYTQLNRNKIFSLISQSRCMIITSTLESFCLPLHEALHFNLDVIAGDFSFITEYKKPDFTINPTSETSIAKAIADYSKNLLG